MCVRACGGLCEVLGAATPPKWDHFLESLFDRLCKDLVKRTAVEKSIGLLVHMCNLARLNVQKNSSYSGFQNASIVYTMFVYTEHVEGLGDEEHYVECR